MAGEVFLSIYRPVSKWGLDFLENQRYPLAVEVGQNVTWMCCVSEQNVTPIICHACMYGTWYTQLVGVAE